MCSIVVGAGITVAAVYPAFILSNGRQHANGRSGERIEQIERRIALMVLMLVAVADGELGGLTHAEMIGGKGAVAQLAVESSSSMCGARGAAPARPSSHTVRKNTSG